MRFTDLHRAALVSIVALAGIGVAGFLGMQAMAVHKESTERDAFYISGKEIPTRNSCINDGLRDAQGKFSRQTAYDIEVRCEQIIQSMEGHASGRTAQR